MDGTAGDVTLLEGDCLERMAEIPAGSVDLIAVDPPYRNVKRDAWDRQWKTEADYLDWIGRLCAEWQRILATNGSLYVFASPQMVTLVEYEIRRRFTVLNQIVWSKADMATHALKYGDERFRQYVQKSERIIFAEHRGSDGMARGEAGWDAMCDELRGFVFEPLRAYLRREMRTAGITPRDINRAVGSSLTGGGMASHYVGDTNQWELPTPEHYHQIQSIAPHHFRREYEDLRREYEDLRREYEDLRRPFTVSAAVPYTDVWDFPTVPARPGKHPCEKPLALMTHIVAASSRPGDVVLDCFLGSGTTGRAALDLGRKFLGIEADPKWFGRARERLGGDRPIAPSSRSHPPAQVANRSHRLVQLSFLEAG